MKRRLFLILTTILAFFLFSGFSEPPIEPDALGCTHRSISPEYSEASHPHEKYVLCNNCGLKIYTGTYAVKNHGNGSWGSGTCPSCGTHTYTGRTCTSAGYCACGASIAATGHSLNGVQYSDAAHPHYYYETCLTCGSKVYTGGNSTKNHGDGSWGSGTCPDCGNHSYKSGTISSAHPHQTKNYCSCGDYIITYTIQRDTCTTCSQNTKAANNSASEQFTFTFFDGEEGGAVIYPLIMQATTNYYNEYYSDSTGSSGNGYHPFSSFTSSVTTSSTIINVHPSVQPTLYSAAHREVKYYNSNGVLLDTQVLSNITPNIGFFTTLLYSLVPKPAYALASAGFGVENVISAPSDTVVEVTTYFQ